MNTEWLKTIIELLDGYVKEQEVFLQTNKMPYENDFKKWQQESKSRVISIFKGYESLEKHISSEDNSNPLSNERNMYYLLSLWLCSYFQKIPRLDIWVDITAIANKFGGYPGGAFYFRLCGDIYRFERRKNARYLRSNHQSVPQLESIIAMTFSPILLLPAEYIPTENWIYTNEILDPIESKFREIVEKASWMYVVKQLRLYTKNKSNLTYICFQQSLCEAVYSLYVKNNGTKNTSESAIKKWYKDSCHKFGTDWLKLFIDDNLNNTHQENNGPRLFIIKNNDFDYLGLTSSLVGSEHGASVNFPNRPNMGWGMVKWLQGTSLKSEKFKISTAKDQLNDNNSIKHNNESAEWFIDQWYDSKLLSVQFKNRIHQSYQSKYHQPSNSPVPLPDVISDSPY